MHEISLESGFSGAGLDGVVLGVKVEEKIPGYPRVVMGENEPARFTVANGEAIEVRAVGGKLLIRALTGAVVIRPHTSNQIEVEVEVG